MSEDKNHKPSSFVDPFDFTCHINSLYSNMLATKEEAFWVGYLMALGSERERIRRMQDCLALIEIELDQWMPIINLIEKAKEVWVTHLKENLEIERKLCEENITKVKDKLRASFHARNAPLPEWLEENFHEA